MTGNSILWTLSEADTDLCSSVCLASDHIGKRSILRFRKAIGDACPSFIWIRLVKPAEVPSKEDVVAYYDKAAVP